MNIVEIILYKYMIFNETKDFSNDYCKIEKNSYQLFLPHPPNF